MAQEQSERGTGRVKCNTQPSTPLNFHGPPLSHDRIKKSNHNLAYIFFVLTRQVYTAFMGLICLQWYTKKQSINIQVIPTTTYVSALLLLQNCRLNCNTVHKKKESLLMHKGLCHSLLYCHNNSVIHFSFHLTERGMDSSACNSKLKLN
jgi:hypothetical protein